MKVVLTAFGGRLRSEFLDWPDGAGPLIRMAMDMDGRQFMDFDDKIKGATPARAVIGLFESNNLSEHRRGESARIYRLIGIE